MRHLSLCVAFAVTACAAGVVDPPNRNNPSGGDGVTSVGSSGNGGSVGSSSANATTATNAASTTTNAAVTSTGAGGMAASLIDDLESGTGSIIMTAGRIGAWFTYNDGTVTGTQTPPMGSAFVPTIGGYMSMLAANTNGSGFTTWGAGMGFDLNNPGSSAATRMPYNVGGWGGITFWAQGNTSIRVMLPTTQITPAAEGGSCATSCSDSHGKVVALTGTWTQYMIPFSQLTQEGWGMMAAFDTSSVLSIQFQVTANAVFDYWIDDISFY